VRDLFDQRLTDPTAAEVVEAIVAAEAAANAGHTTGNLTSSGSSAAAMAERLLREPEGMNGHFGGANRPTNIARLSMGWWTNSAGRKFVCVRSWREQSRRYDQYGNQTVEFDRTESDRVRRPGVWQVDYERVIEASSGGEPEWVAVCGCGAAGSPASLAWQHGMCGPCADRIAEFGPDAVMHAPGLLAETDFEPTDVVFSPGGKYIVAVGGERYCLWDTASGERRVQGTRPTPNSEARPAVSPDGEFIFLGDGVARLTLLNVNDRFSLIEVPMPPVLAAYWSRWPGVLIVQCIGGSMPFSLVKVLSARSADFQSTTPQPTHGARLVAVPPDGSRVVFANQHRASVARLTREGALTTEAQFNLGEGRLNRTGMWQGSPEIVRFTPDGERLLFIRGAEMELRLPARPKALLQATFPQPIRDAAFSPDYEHLFILGADGIIYVCNPGTLTSVRARLRWHFWPPSRLAVSPDGQTLATAGPEGVKLWPVAQLMPLLG
jgi:hypothetical protein